MSPTKEPSSIASQGAADRGNTAQRFRPQGIDFADFKPQAFSLAARRQGRDHHAQPARAEEPADARILRRVARHVPRPRLRRRRQGGGDHRRGRQFLLGRRRARDHRPARRDAAQGRHGGPARVHPHDRRPGEGDARLPAADRGGGRRRLRRRRRHPGDGVGPAVRHRAQQGRVPVRARRARRRRHGCVQHPAAHRRRGPRRRTALHRTHHGRRRGRALGLLQPAVRTGCRAGRRAGAGEDRSPTARPSRTP